MREDFTQSCQGECKKALLLLESIIDGESTVDEEDFFYEHIDECTPCLRHYNIDRTMVNAVKLKIERKKCPESVINSIRQTIKHIKL